MVSPLFILNRNLAELGKDWNADATREEAFKVWNVQFNAKPKENVVSIEQKPSRKIPANFILILTYTQTVGHTWTKQTEWKNDAYVESVKTASKFGLKAHGVRSTAGFANDKFSFSAGGQILKEQDWTVDTTGSFETKPAKKEWKATGATTVASPDFSGVKAFVNVSLSISWQNEIMIRNTIFFF